MKKINKTNAMRILDKANVPYEIHTYEHKEGEALDGVHVAQRLGLVPSQVFKTIITQGTSKDYYAFILPVEFELDLKKCAQCVHEKNIAMIPVKEITKVSGYVRGGCSPFGMKKQYRTTFHSSCKDYDTIYVSGGKIGCQIQMNPLHAIGLLNVQLSDITK